MTNDTTIALQMPVARVVVKGLVKGDSLLAVHKITLEKLAYQDSVINAQRLLIVNRDSTVILEREINAQLRVEMNKKDSQIAGYKEAAIINEKKYKKEKFNNNIKTTGLIMVTTGLILSLILK